MNTLIIVALFVASAITCDARTRFSFDEENMAKYGVSTLGGNVKLIKIKSITPTDVSGTVYDIKVKVRRGFTGGLKGRVVEHCTIKVLKKQDGSIKVTESFCE